VVRKSPLEPLEIVSSPRGKCVARNDGSAFVTIRGDSKAGLGECLPELPEGGLPTTTTSHGNELQAVSSSLPVENEIGKQVDTIYTRAGHRREGRVEIENRNEIKQRRKGNQKGIQVLGYVPIQIVNLSLEEVKMGKQKYVGVASSIQGNETQRREEYDVSPALRDEDTTSRRFDDYLQEKTGTFRQNGTLYFRTCFA